MICSKIGALSARVVGRQRNGRALAAHLLQCFDLDDSVMIGIYHVHQPSEIDFVFLRDSILEKGAWQR
jgi:hypothetical protein